MPDKDDFRKMTDEGLVVMAQEGNDEAADFILSKYKDMVSAEARPYYILGADRADVVQEGMIGLFKAVQTYDSDGEAAFRTYAGICINRQIIDAVKAANRKKHIPLNTFVPIEEREYAADVSYEVLDVAEQIEKIATDNFSGMERQVWSLYMQGLSQKEIASRLNKDDKSIYNAMERIKKKVKQAIM